MQQQQQQRDQKIRRLKQTNQPHNEGDAQFVVLQIVVFENDPVMMKEQVGGIGGMPNANSQSVYRFSRTWYSTERVR
jgi:hypothetical protein